MAGIDHSIYFNQKTPELFGAAMDGYEQGRRLSGLAKQQQREDAAYNRQKGLQDKEDEFNAEVEKSYVMGPDGRMTQDPAAYERLAGISGKKTYEMQKQQMVDSAAAKKQQLDAYREKANFGAQMLGGINDEKTYAITRPQLIKAGIFDENELPEQFDPSIVNTHQIKALEVKDQLDNFFKEQDLALKRNKDKRESAESNANIAKTKADTSKVYADAGKTRAELSSPQIRLSEGEKAVDKRFAENYNDFTSKGKDNALQSIQNLETLANEIEKDNGYFAAGGGRAGSLHDVFRSRNSIKYRDTAVSEANKSLKEIMGGANLTDADREANARAVYNDQLGNEENVKLIRKKVAELKTKVATESAKAQYFQANGTLKGFSSGNSMMAGGPPQEKVWEGIRYQQQGGNWVAVGPAEVAKK